MPICPGCQKEKPIKAKGLCNACYVQLNRRGTLERERQPRGMCTVPGCDKKAHGRGLCDMHLRRMRVSGSFDDPRADNINLMTNQKLYAQWSEYRRKDGYPIVPEWKDDFPTFMAAVGERPSFKHRLYRIDKSLPMGPGNFEWRERFATGIGLWNSDLKRAHGITLVQLKAMAEAQDHKCAICGKPETDMRNGIVQHLAVDHSHKTGKNRELCCASHNKGIGFFQEDMVTMVKAILYLHKHAEDKTELGRAIAYLDAHKNDYPA